MTYYISYFGLYIHYSVKSFFIPSIQVKKDIKNTLARETTRPDLFWG